MIYPEHFMELAQERRGFLLRELAVIDKFIENYGPAVAEGTPFVVPADTPDPPAPKPGAITMLEPGEDPSRIVAPTHYACPACKDAKDDDGPHVTCYWCKAGGRVDEATFERWQEFAGTRDKQKPPIKEPVQDERKTSAKVVGEELACDKAAKAKPRPWTAEDNERLLAYREQGLKVPVIAGYLERTPMAVTARIAKLKAGVKPSNMWTADEEDLLQLLYVERCESLAVIEDKLGRTKSAVRHYIARLGLRRLAAQEPGRAPKAGRGWISDEVAELERLFDQGISTKKIALILHRGSDGVRAKIRALGLTRVRIHVGRPKGGKNETKPKLPLGHEFGHKTRDPDPVRKTLAESSPMNAWTEEQNRVLEREWKRGWMSNYTLAKNLGKPAPEVTRRARQLKLGSRTRVFKTRLCMKDDCDVRFKPEDWTKEWYCLPHRMEMRHTPTPVSPQESPSRRAFHSAPG